jgi:hypothetical protein
MKSSKQNQLAIALGIAVLIGGTSPAFARHAPSMGEPDFALLSAAPEGSGAVTCTDSIIFGDVGSSGEPASIVQTNCTINGAIVAPVAAGVVDQFNDAYGALAAMSCDQVLTGTLAGVTLAPGVYCFDAAAAVTGTLTLAGPVDGLWIFKVGNTAVGALTGTDFQVAMAGGATACNVYWWVDAAATLTTSNFAGTILAGAAITLTGGTFNGDALARAAVTVTGVTATGCDGSSSNPPPRQACNQGVGNGAEGCDPGNSNQGDPLRSNDELGGLPGNPGRRGGNRIP